MYVFDTDHLSLFQRGHVPLKKRIFSISTEQLGITIISAEEVLRGRLAQVRRAGCADERIKAYYWFSKTLEFLQSFPILSYDTQAEAYFQTFLERKIRIGVQDLKIAAIALSRHATLLTRNHNDFRRIPALHIEDWS